MKEFNWVGFKKGEFHVYCETQEDSKDFLQECEKEGMYGQKIKTNQIFGKRGIYYSVKTFMFFMVNLCCPH